MLSLIRFSAPRHAIRHDNRGVLRHPATKVVAAPLVTATAVVAMDAVDEPAAPPVHAVDSTVPRPSTAPANMSYHPVPTTTAPAPPAPITIPPSTTSTTNTTTHLLPTAPAVSSRRVAAPVREAIKAPAKAAARAPAKAPVTAGANALASNVVGPHTARSTPLGDYAGSGEPGALGQLRVDHRDPSRAGLGLPAADERLGRHGRGGRVRGLDARPVARHRVPTRARGPDPPWGFGGTLAEGATGAYNQYFTILAQTLVKDGAANAILRLGWEFNGTWYPWSVANNTDAQNFAAFWRQIVNTMRAVPGQQFKFLWNPNGGGSSSWNLELAYPGSAYVDYIGTDVYDEYWGSPFTPQASWNSALTQTWGLNWLATFAAAEGRPIAIPEWSVDFRDDGFGLGDDPNFINQFSSWIAAHNVAFTCIFSYNDTAGGQDNDITDGRFSNALAAFRADF